MSAFKSVPAQREHCQHEIPYLNTTYDGGSECRVALCAQHDGIHQNKAVQHTEGEVNMGYSVAFSTHTQWE